MDYCGDGNGVKPSPASLQQCACNNIIIIVVVVVNMGPLKISERHRHPLHGVYTHNNIIGMCYFITFNLLYL